MSLALAMTVVLGLLTLAIAIRWLWWWLKWRTMSEAERAKASRRAREQMLNSLTRINIERAFGVHGRAAEGYVLLLAGWRAEEEGDFERAMRYFRRAGIILTEKESRHAVLARNGFDRMRTALGEAEFDRILGKIEQAEGADSG